MQWIAPHLRNEKGPVATCYPYASSSCPSSQFFALDEPGCAVKIIGSNDGGTLTRSEYLYLTVLSSSNCIRYFTVANASLLSFRSVTLLAFLRETRHPSSLSHRLSSRVRRVRSRVNRINKNALNIVYLGYSKRRGSNKGK